MGAIHNDPTNPPQQIAAGLKLVFLGVFSASPTHGPSPNKSSVAVAISLVGGCNQPIWKIWVKLGSSSLTRGEHKQISELPPPSISLVAHLVPREKIPHFAFTPPQPALPLHHWLSSHVHSASRRPFTLSQRRIGELGPIFVPLKIRMGRLYGSYGLIFCGKNGWFSMVPIHVPLGILGFIENWYISPTWIGWFSMVNYK